MSLLPKELIPVWQMESPHCANSVIHIDGENDSLFDISQKLDWGKSEISGGIGITWLSISQGQRSEAICRPESLFTWHYHPSGSLAFSFQDWVAFLLSGALVSCLYTRNGICLFLKQEHQKRTVLVKELHDKWSLKQGCPNLFFLEAKRLLEEFCQWNSPPDVLNSELATQLGIYCEEWTGDK